MTLLLTYTMPVASAIYGFGVGFIDRIFASIHVSFFLFLTDLTFHIIKGGKNEGPCIVLIEGTWGCTLLGYDLLGYGLVWASQQGAILGASGVHNALAPVLNAFHHNCYMRVIESVCLDHSMY